MRIMVVDDSAYMRRLLGDLLHSDPSIEVAGYAVNGADALHRVSEVQPDVILMDVDMPVMDGSEATERIMTVHPTPIVLLGVAENGNGQLTIRGLEAGAISALLRPMSLSAMDYPFRDELLRKVQIAAGSTPRPRPEVIANRAIGDPNAVYILLSGEGGVSPVTALVSVLPPDLAGQFFVLQRGPAELAEAFSQRLRSLSRAPLARIFLQPEVDIRELAREHGDRVRLLVLSGHGDAQGIDDPAGAGGKVFVQSPGTCACRGMPDFTLRTVKDARAIDPIDMAITLLQA